MYVPKLHLHDQPIHLVGNQTTRFLGGTVQITFDSKSSRNSLSPTLSTMLKKVDAVSITSHQKLFLYQAAVCPKLNWDFMVNQLPISWVTATLEATTTRFLKKWLGLAKPADPSRLYLPKKKGGLGLPLLAQSTRNNRVCCKPDSHLRRPCGPTHSSPDYQKNPAQTNI